MTDQTTSFDAPARSPAHHDSLENAMDAAMSAGGGEKVSVGEVLDVLATRPIGTILFVPALISVLPGVGALPGVTWITSFLVLVISLQTLLTGETTWAPEFVRQVKMKRSVLRKSLRWAKPPVRWIDRVTAPRLVLLVRGPFVRFMALTTFVLSLAMFVTSIIPGGVVLPGIVVLILATALVTQDGMVALFGYGLSLGAVLFALWLLF